MTLHRIFCTQIVLLGFLLVSVSAYGQYTEGTIAGVVTDPTGAAVPGAKVILLDQATRQTRELNTDAVGYYRAPSLRPGKYEIRVEASGFKAAVLKDIEVRVNVTTRADVSLELGELAETVEVVGGASLIQTEEARLAHTFETRQVTELPLNGREIYQLITLQPGVSQALAPTISNVPSPNSPGTFDFTFVSNGATPRGNNYSLDGTTNNNEWLGGTPVIFPSIDAIQEFQVQTLNFSAEYGRNNGAVANVITKSGTNTFHGSVFYFHRNTALNARNFFDQIPGVKTPLLHHQYGATIGGPVNHDKTFFFGSFEGSRRKDGDPELGTGETADFRQLVAAQRPGSIASMFFQDFPSPPCRPGTEEDAGSLVPPGPFQELAFDPTPDGVNDYCETIATQIQSHQVDQYMVRLDHNFSDSDKVFGRWIASHSPTDVSRQQLLNANHRGFRSPLDGFYGDLATGFTHLFSPTWLNDFRFAFNRNNTRISFEVPDGDTATALDSAGLTDIFAHLSFSDGVIPFGGVVFIPRTFVFNTFTVADTMTQTVGRHALKYGFEWRYIRENSNYLFETMPFYIFDSIFTFANDQPWLAEGLVNRDPSSPDFGQFTDTPRHFRWHNLGLFFQDDWKVRSNLTLNLGLRYEVFTVPTERDGILSNLVLGPGSNIFEQVAGARAERVSKLADTDYNNVAPRIGIAWDPLGSGTAVVRSGFSVAFLEAYSNLYTNVSRFLPPDAAWVDSFPIFGVGTDPNYTFPFEESPDFAAPSTPNGAVQGSGLFPPGLNPNIRTAYSMQWFLGLQQQLFGDYAFEVNYVGTRGVKLYVREDWNRVTGDICNATTCDFFEDRLAPGFFQLFYVDNGTNSSYHGMNMQFRKDYSHGFMFTANYTWSKTLDLVSGPGLGDFFNVSNGRYTGTQDIIDRAADYGPSDFDVRQVFNLNALWDLPSPYNGSSTLLDKVVNGWQLNTIIAAQSGRPFTVFCATQWFNGCDFNMDGTEFDRPNAPSGIQTSGWSTSEFADPDGIFSVSDFCPGGLTPFFLGTPCVPVGTNGDLGRNTFRGPVFATVDFAVFKNTSISEKLKVQFRAEMFNLFNHTNLFLPNGNLSSGNFGTSTRAFPSRQIQFGLKFLF